METETEKYLNGMSKWNTTSKETTLIRDGKK